MNQTPAALRATPDERNEVAIARIDDRERLGIVKRGIAECRQGYDDLRAVHDLFDETGLVDGAAMRRTRPSNVSSLAKSTSTASIADTPRARSAGTRWEPMKPPAPSTAIRCGITFCLVLSCPVLGGRRRFGRGRCGLGRFGGAAGVCPFCRRLGVGGQRRRRSCLCHAARNENIGPAVVGRNDA